MPRKKEGPPTRDKEARDKWEAAQLERLKKEEANGRTQDVGPSKPSTSSKTEPPPQPQSPPPNPLQSNNQQPPKENSHGATVPANTSHQPQPTAQSSSQIRQAFQPALAKFKRDDSGVTQALAKVKAWKYVHALRTQWVIYQILSFVFFSFCK
jgi:hypothetical protein